MKYAKLVNELDNLLDSAGRQHLKHQKILECYIEQFKLEEQKLNKKLKKQNNDTGRRKLMRELGVVKQAYAILGS